MINRFLIVLIAVLLVLNPTYICAESEANPLESWTDAVLNAEYTGVNFKAYPSPDLSEIILTPDASYRIGAASFNTMAFCAHEFEAEVEFYAGDRTDGGYIINVAFQRLFPAQIVDNREIGVGFYTNTSDGRRNTELVPGDNALQILSNETSYQEYKTSPIRPYGYFSALSAVEAPFPLKGSGWLKVYFHVSDGLMTATVTNGVESATVQGTHSPTGNIALAPAIVADTGPWRNVHKARNLKIRVIREGVCPGFTPPLEIEEINEAVDQACTHLKNCTTVTDYQQCVETTLDALSEQYIVAETDKAVVFNTLGSWLTYCQGINECSAEMETVIAQNYELGFNAGVASIDQDAIVAEAYQEGYDAGRESVVCDENDDQDSDTLTEDAARSLLNSACSCSEAPNHGQYASCVVHYLNNLRDQGLISDELRALLVTEAAQSDCGKKNKGDLTIKELSQSLRGVVREQRKLQRLLDKKRKQAKRVANRDK